MSTANLTTNTNQPHIQDQITDRTAWIIKAIFWPITAVLFIHRVFIVHFNQIIFSNTDFDIVWSGLEKFNKGEPVYQEISYDTDPQYLYGPGATLILSPFEFLGNSINGQIFFEIVCGLCVIGSVLILFRLFSKPLSSPLLPVVMSMVFLSEGVFSSMAMGNVNTILLLFEVGFIYYLSRGKTIKSQILVAVFLTIAILVKPMFAPLLILIIFRKFWWSLLITILAYCGINALGWSMMKEPEGFVNNLLPYLRTTRDYTNSSIAGLAEYYRMGPKAEYALRALVIILVGIAVLALLRWINTDTVFWITTSTGIILVGVFLASNLGQAYYTLFLLPMFLSVISPTRTITLNPVFWFAVAFASIPLDWYTSPPRSINAVMNYTFYTAAWMVILLCAVTTVLYFYWTETHPKDLKTSDSSEQASAESLVSETTS